MKKETIKSLIAYLVAVLVFIGISIGAFFIFANRMNIEQASDELAGANYSFEIPVEKHVIVGFEAQDTELRAIRIVASDVTEEASVKITYGVSEANKSDYVFIKQQDALLKGGKGETIELSCLDETNNGVTLEKGEVYSLHLVFTPYDDSMYVYLYGLEPDPEEPVNVFNGYIMNGEMYPGTLCRDMVYNSNLRDAQIGKIWFIILLVIIDIVLLLAFHWVYQNRKSITFASKGLSGWKNNTKMSVGAKIRFVSYVMLIISMVFGRGNHADYSNVFLLLTIITMIGGYACDFVGKDDYDTRYCLQSFVGCVLIIAWYVMALISPYTEKDHIVYIILETICILVMTAFWVLRLKGKWSHVAYRLKGEIKTYLWVPPVLVVAIVVSLDTFGWLPIWDNGIYLENFWNCRNWDFTFGSPNWYQTLGHLTFGAKLMLLPGLAFTDNVNLGTRINLLCLICMMIALAYSLFRKLAPNARKHVTMLVTLAFTMFPPVLSMQGVNLDYMSVLVIVALLWAYYYELKVFQVGFALILCLCKEPMAVLFAGFCLGGFLRNLVENRIEDKYCLIDGSRISEYLRMVFPAISWLMIFLGSRLAVMELPKLFSEVFASEGDSYSYIPQWGTRVFVSDGVVSGEEAVQTVNHLGAKYDHILSIIGQMFTFNFLWIPVAIALICIIVCAVRKKDIIRWSNLFPMIFAFAASAAFNCIYHTYNVYRYAVPAAVMVLIMSLVVILNSIRLEVIIIPATVIMTILFSIESYTLIDPITLLQGEVYSSGNGKLLNVDGDEGIYFYSGIQINQQGYDYGQFLQEIMRAVKCDENSLILIPLMREDDNGFSMKGLHAYYDIYYNADKEMLDTYSPDGRDGFNVQWGIIKDDGEIEYICSKTEGITDGNYGRVYVVDTPYADRKTAEEYIAEAGYSECGRTYAKYRTWKADIIEVRK